MVLVKVGTGIGTSPVDNDTIHAASPIQHTGIFVPVYEPIALSPVPAHINTLRYERKPRTLETKSEVRSADLGWYRRLISTEEDSTWCRQRERSKLIVNRLLTYSNTNTG